MTLLLGVDGGGTKTRALVGDAGGRVLGVGEAGSSNAKSVGFDAATAALRSAVAEALARAGATAPLAAACLGLAGVETDADRQRMEAWLRTERLAARGIVVHDSEIVLGAAVPAAVTEPWGVALICGTGSVCLGVSRAGERRRVGGWGHLLGDEGSGYDVAVRALHRATASADGRYGETALVEAALAHWASGSLPALMDAIYARPPTRTEVAAFASRVVALAEAGDAGARDCLDAAASDAAHLLDTVVRWIADAEATVAYAGGLLRYSALFRQLVTSRVTVPISTPVVVDDPARGALVLARLDAGRL